MDTGKLECRIDVPVSQELKDDFHALARMHGFKGEADFARDIFYRLVYGELAMFQRNRRAGIRSMGETSDE